MKRLIKKPYRYLLIIPAIFILWLIGGINIESTSQQIVISKQIDDEVIEYDSTAQTYFYWGWRGKRLKAAGISISPTFIIEGMNDESSYNTFAPKQIDIQLVGFERRADAFLPATVSIRGKIEGICSSQGAKERISHLLWKIQQGKIVRYKS